MSLLLINMSLISKRNFFYIYNFVKLNVVNVSIFIINDNNY